MVSIALVERIERAAKEAMKNRDAFRLSVLRMILSSFHNKVIEKRTRGGDENLTPEEVIVLLRSEVKKRREAVDGFGKGGRNDLVEKESAEIKIIEEYLPAELPEEEIKRIIEDVVNHWGPVTIKDFGRVMGEVMKKIKNQTSGEKVSQLVRNYFETI